MLNFTWPDVDADYRFEPLAAKVETVTGAPSYASDRRTVFGRIFEMAWLLPVLENLLVDFLADPDLAHALCEKLTELRVRQAVRYAELGVDILRLGDDVGTQTGPMIGLETYRTFLKRRTRRFDRRRQITSSPTCSFFMHCDGQVADFIPEFLFEIFFFLTAMDIPQPR